MAKYYKNLVQKPKYEARTDFDDVKGQQYPTMTFMSNEFVPGSNVYIEKGWIWAMPNPNPHIPEHTHAESDEFVLHIGPDYKNHEDLGGEIEFVVGGEPLKINRTSALYVPAGVVHGPLTWKSVAQPHLQITIIMGAGTLAEAAPAGYKGK